MLRARKMRGVLVWAMANMFCVAAACWLAAHVFTSTYDQKWALNPLPGPGKNWAWLDVIARNPQGQYVLLGIRFEDWVGGPAKLDAYYEEYEFHIPEDKIPQIERMVEKWVEKGGAPARIILEMVESDKLSGKQTVYLEFYTDDVSRRNKYVVDKDRITPLSSGTSEVFFSLGLGVVAFVICMYAIVVGNICFLVLSKRKKSASEESFSVPGTESRRGPLFVLCMAAVPVIQLIAVLLGVRSLLTLCFLGALAFPVLQSRVRGLALWLYPLVSGVTVGALLRFFTPIPFLAAKLGWPCYVVWAVTMALIGTWVGVPCGMRLVRYRLGVKTN